MGSLKPYENNSRTHSDEQIDQICASIKEFGFINPVIIDTKNGIVAGHGRVLAAQKLELETVPCLEVTHLSEAQIRAFIIADNKIAQNAGWDYDILKTEFQALEEMNFNLEITGFNGNEIGEIFNGFQTEIKPKSDFKEIDISKLDHVCPKCGFEFDD